MYLICVYWASVFWLGTPFLCGRWWLITIYRGLVWYKTFAFYFYPQRSRNYLTNGLIIIYFVSRMIGWRWSSHWQSLFINLFLFRVWIDNWWWSRQLRHVKVIIGLNFIGAFARGLRVLFGCYHLVIFLQTPMQFNLSLSSQIVHHLDSTWVLKVTYRTNITNLYVHVAAMAVF